jgi:energy-coupling factor transporter ATP-binding protein EcfA2
MSSEVTITSLEFRNFKALDQFSISLQHMNVLVGPNNSGKSTVLSALRALAEGLRRARAKSADRVVGPGGETTLGYRISEDSLPISVENVHTDYEETDTRVIFRLSNRNVLQLYFPRDGGCSLLTDVNGRPTYTPGEFRKAFPISIGIVPVLGPVEHEEALVNEETVRRGLATHRASRHFRNYWRYYPQGFEVFADLVAGTWPGMKILSPEIDAQSGKLTMFAEEERIPRELFWSGFGFQIWCQLLTHISRATQDTLIVIDEPEIYLHPDIQRQLLGILRAAGPDIVLATHSTEMIAEADPSDIVLIDKSKRSAQRLRDIEGVQTALDAIGSLQNITLTQLARNRKILFVEGSSDYRTIRRFARQAGFAELAAGSGLTLVETGGFTSWDRVKSTAWGIEKTLGSSLDLAAIFDRDYFAPEQIDSILSELNSHLKLAHIHSRKEMENYLLVPEVIERAFNRALAERARRLGEPILETESVSRILDRVSAPLRTPTQAQYVAKRTRYLEHDPRDEATITAETMEWFDSKWATIPSRMEIVPGKDVLKGLREEIQSKYGVNLTDFRIIDEFRIEEIPTDLRKLLCALEEYRTR